MNLEHSMKVKPHHLKRNAYLYVRQSTLKQVLENTESTKRQYGLGEQARRLGWASDQIITIDRDLGHSGTSTADREGFQWLVSEVSLSHAGLVMGLEVSRLSRNCADWHRLLEICDFTDTLLLDEDGLYDPGDFNDRVLLGFKGTMSEIEWRGIRARLQGALLSKARRGEFMTPLPTGLVYDEDGHVLLDPDRQIQDSIRFIFDTFRRTGSAYATLKAFRKEKLLMPWRQQMGRSAGKISFVPITSSRIQNVLHNPRYAGIYYYGRTRRRRSPEGKYLFKRLADPSEWTAFIPNAHPGYITLQEFQEIQLQLKQNDARNTLAAARGTSPREGEALLQGRALCGVCGQRMCVAYRVRYGVRSFNYKCVAGRKKRGEKGCQALVGRPIDAAISQLILANMSPVVLELALEIQQELGTRLEEAERLRYQAVERAEYEVEQARRRFMRVDPDNRLVADTLETAWNEKLRLLRDARQVYEQGRKTDQLELDEVKRARVLKLAEDFPRLWYDPSTPARERKRMLALLIEDVTLRRQEREVHIQIRFKGGRSETLTAPVPKCSWESLQTSKEVVIEIDRLLNTHTPRETARSLNERNFKPGGADRFKRTTFNGKMVSRIARDYGLTSRKERLLARGMVTTTVLSERLGVPLHQIHGWIRTGRLLACPLDAATLMVESLGEAFEAASSELSRGPSARMREELGLFEGQSGMTDTDSPSRPLPPPELLSEVDRLLDAHTCTEIAASLNLRGLRPYDQRYRRTVFDQKMIARFIRYHGLKSRYERLRERGMLTAAELAHRLGTHIWAIYARAEQGEIITHRVDQGRNLFEPPPDAAVDQGMNVSEPASGVAADQGMR